MDVHSEEKNRLGNPLLTGTLLDLSSFDAEDDDEQVEAIKNAVFKFQKHNPKFSFPLVVVDLAERKNIRLFDNDEKEVPAPASDEILRVVVSAWDIADLQAISNPGNSIIKVNSAFPCFLWFRAANLLLNDRQKPGRLIPFPLDQENGTILYHALRTTPEEFNMYQQILEFALTQNNLEKAFEISARFSYEVLKNRGYSDLTASAVDHLITHLMIKNEDKIRGIIIEDLKKEICANEELKKNHIFY